MKQYILLTFFEQYIDFLSSDFKEIGRVERYSISIVYENDILLFTEDLHRFLSNKHSRFMVERSSLDNIHYIDVFFEMGFMKKIESIQKVAGKLNIKFIKDYIERNYTSINLNDIKIDMSVINNGLIHIFIDSFDDDFVDIEIIKSVFKQAGISEDNYFVLSNHTFGEFGASLDNKFQLIALAIQIAPEILKLIISILQSKAPSNSVDMRVSEINISTLLSNLSKIASVNLNDLTVTSISKKDSKNYAIVVKNRYKTFLLEATRDGRITRCLR